MVRDQATYTDILACVRALAAEFARSPIQRVREAGQVTLDRLDGLAGREAQRNGAARLHFLEKELLKTIGEVARGTRDHA